MNNLDHSSITFAEGEHQEIIFPVALVDVVNKISVELHTIKLMKTPGIHYKITFTRKHVINSSLSYYLIKFIYPIAVELHALKTRRKIILFEPSHQREAEYTFINKNYFDPGELSIEMLNPPGTDKAA